MRGWNGVSNPRTRLREISFEQNDIEEYGGRKRNLSNLSYEEMTKEYNRQKKAAEIYYTTRVNNGVDAFVNKINANTGYPKSRLKRIYNHVFITEHDLEDGHHRFYPNFDMSQSFQRKIFILNKSRTLEYRYNMYFKVFLTQKYK